MSCRLCWLYFHFQILWTALQTSCFNCVTCVVLPGCGLSLSSNYWLGPMTSDTLFHWKWNNRLDKLWWLFHKSFFQWWLMPLEPVGASFYYSSTIATSCWCWQVRECKRIWFLWFWLKKSLAKQRILNQLCEMSVLSCLPNLVSDFLSTELVINTDSRLGSISKPAPYQQSQTLYWKPLHSS